MPMTRDDITDSQQAERLDFIISEVRKVISETSDESLKFFLEQAEHNLRLIRATVNIVDTRDAHGRTIIEQIIDGAGDQWDIEHGLELKPVAEGVVESGPAPELTLFVGDAAMPESPPD